MKIATVGIDKVLLDPANVRRHPERNLETIKSSLARFGQQVPIVVDKDWVCRKGNGTLLAARALEWDTIRIVRTELSGTEATGFAIADNRSSELAEWDDEALAETLRALRADEVDMVALGFMDDEVDRLLERISGELVDDPNGEWKGMPEFEHEDQTEGAAFIIRVFLKNKRELSALGKLLGKDLTDRKFVWFGKQPISKVVNAVDSH